MKSSNSFCEKFIEIGRVVRSHGLGGRVKVRSYLEKPEALQDLSELLVGRGVSEARWFPVAAIRTGQGFFTLKLGGIDDREAADGICGSSVWMPVDRMQKLPEGEYYWNEIVGLQVVTEEGRELGRIDAVFPTGSNDVYVCREGKREILLPAIEEVVRRIDRDRGVMVVRLLKGLMGS